MSWNAGHLGQQQWGKLKTWLAAEAEQYCDVLVLQETHWKESSEFRVSGGTASLRPRPQNKAGSLRLLTRDASLARTIRKDHLPPEQMES